MIDLLGNGDLVPAPISTDPIVAMLNDMAVYEGEPPLLVLSSLISEVKMWRAKDEYDRKMKLVIGGAIEKKLNDSDL